MTAALLARPKSKAPLPASAAFRAIGTWIELHVTDDSTLPEALLVLRSHLADLDRVASRFRSVSEVSRLARDTRPEPPMGPEPVRVVISDLLADHVRAALRAARLTEGLVDPTVGAAVVASGYDADLDVVRARGAGSSTNAAHVAGWQSLTLVGNRLTMPGGTLLDLGATAKAHAADRVAARLAATLPGGFLVNLGGDIAVSGECPEEGWQVGVSRADGQTAQTVRITDQAVATSSTRLRTWRAGGVQRHHIVDPRTGHTAAAVWDQVTCAAATSLEANAATTAAIVLGETAPGWLTDRGLAARLERADGTVVRTPGWPGAVTR